MFIPYNLNYVQNTIRVYVAYVHHEANSPWIHLILQIPASVMVRVLSQLKHVQSRLMDARGVSELSTLFDAKVRGRNPVQNMQFSELVTIHLVNFQQLSWERVRWQCPVRPRNFSQPNILAAA